MVLNQCRSWRPSWRPSSHLCLGSVKACPPSFRHFGPGDKRSGGWGGRDREGEVTADKSCWPDTPLPDSWRWVLLFSQQLPPVGTWAPLPHPLGLQCHPSGESQTHPTSPDPRSVLSLLLVWQLFAHTLLLSAQAFGPLSSSSATHPSHPSRPIFSVSSSRKPVLTTSSTQLSHSSDLAPNLEPSSASSASLAPLHELRLPPEPSCGVSEDLILAFFHLWPGEPTLDCVWTTASSSTATVKHQE